MPMTVPHDDLISRRFFLRAWALPPKTEVTVGTAAPDRHGACWQAEATYRTTAAGALDLWAQPALTGRFRGVDPAGPVWSLRPRPDHTPAFFEAPEAGVTLTVRLSAGECVLEETTVRRLTHSPDLRETPVREDGLYGSLFSPAPGTDLRGACLCLGGSEGGLYSPVAALLASEGFLVLNLAYFGVPDSGLPENLINLPLEYFGQAAAWLRARPEVAGRRVGVTGASKGAEAALLVGATFPQDIGAVAAFAPSWLVFEGIDRAGTFPPGPPMSSWSFRGQPWPYLPYHTDWAAFFAAGPQPMTPVHRRAARQASAAQIAAATIPAERVAGPVLLVSGGEDQVWHAAELAEVAQRRREAAGRPSRHLTHPHAGHHLSLPGLPTYIHGLWTPGGEEQANAHLQFQAWEAQLKTLAAIWA